MENDENILLVGHRYRHAWKRLLSLVFLMGSCLHVFSTTQRLSLFGRCFLASISLCLQTELHLTLSTSALLSQSNLACLNPQSKIISCSPYFEDAQKVSLQYGKHFFACARANFSAYEYYFFYRLTCYCRLKMHTKKYSMQLFV